jgi:thiol-disulfide isomerase/thioredoxin
MYRSHQILFLALLGFFIAPMPVEAQIRVHGTLLGADGQPMPAAHVVVQDGPVDTSVVAEANEKGRFTLTLPRHGGYGMYLMGVHHETLEAPLIVTPEEPVVELHARLGTHKYDESPDSVWVATVSNDYQQQSATLMRSDGAVLRASVPSETDTLAYQVIGIRKSLSPRRAFTMSGTGADRYAFNEDGLFWDSRSDYISVLDGLGASPADVTFNPTRLPPSGREPTVRSDNKTIDNIIAIYQETEAMERRLGEKSQTFRPLFENARTDEERAALRDSLQRVMAQFADSLTAPIKRRIEREDNPLVRQWMMLRYFDELNPSEQDSTLARRALHEIPPTSPLWSYEAWSRVGAGNLIFLLARYANKPKLASAYIDEVIQAHSDPDVRRHFLYRGVQMADNAGDEKRKMRYYGQMMGEFAGSYHAQQIEREYAPEKDIQRGNPIPDFALPSMSDSSVVYTDEGMLDSIYLIDTWAVWCGPCIAEMDEHHEAYEKYKDRGFDILSISLDEAPEDVKAFRQKRWPMPWKHNFAGFSGEGRKVVEETFEVVGIPHPILVDENGQIIATEEALRGNKLLQTLERVFGY